MYIYEIYIYIYSICGQHADFLKGLSLNKLGCSTILLFSPLG